MPAPLAPACPRVRAADGSRVQGGSPVVQGRSRVGMRCGDFAANGSSSRALSRPAATAGGACGPDAFLRGRESIFSETHREWVSRNPTARPAARRRVPRPARRSVGIRGEGRKRSAAGGKEKERIEVRFAAAAPGVGCGSAWSFSSFFEVRARSSPLASPGEFCMGVSRFLAKPIQNGFCGTRPSAHQPAKACPALRVGRWVYEKALWGGRPVHTGRLHTAAFAGCSVPFHTSPLLRGALRSAGVPTIAASTTTAPPAPAAEGISEESSRRKGVPRVRRGLGSVGDWRFATLTIQPPGVPAGWRSLQGCSLPVGASSWGA